jgi:small subunit ribosomal protein S6
MALYEQIFLARHDISGQQMDGLIEKFSAILKENGGKVVGKENWGLRTLAYRIKKSRKAHYGYIQIDADHKAVAEMERQMKLSNEVLRILSVRVEEHDKLPSVIMRKPDRDDRRSRRGGRHDGPRRDGPRRDGPRKG